ncbi:DUF881 domain-containing protein [Actinomadura parmotrematis]|uniref:DUF881 domain-containing protein n=1 Tax=Actinomadura parmotrematis TaxID=2864039 RepID=A0ABS7FQY0_9ACTN|nr:DUF881 domain-containing protein [Actinomadura parmotrematis]MBW8482810.1 DUF881 domain-containing protein [Actinomadura parmotrematis]
MDRQARAPGGPPGWRRPDASMSLLADLHAGRVLDPGYADAAARRAAAGDAAPRRSPLRGGGVLLVLVLTGVLLAVAGAETRRSEPVAAQQRHRLVDAIRARTEESDALQRRLDALRTETERLRAAGLARSEEGRRARRDLAAAAAAAAAQPAAGPALVAVLDDAPPDAAPPARDGAAPGDGRVYDRDLQAVVNGLWAAGATAIAINGQRLTPTTAVRTAGEAILVDYRPLTGPYRVTALGDPGRLRAAYRGSAADRRTAALHDRFRIRYDLETAKAARLPAAGALRLRYARPLPAGPAGGTARGEGDPP